MNEANAVAAKEPTRMERRGYAPKTARKPIAELNAEQRLFLEYVLHGCGKPDLCDQVGVKPSEPMSIEQAADLCRIRRRFARWLFEQAAFKKAYASGLEAIRNGYRVKAIHTQGEIMQNEGDGSAAFATARLKAATALLDNGEGRGGNTSINITNQTVNLQPGVVIRLPANVSVPPLELQSHDDAPLELTAAERHEETRGLSEDPAAEQQMARAWPRTTGGDE